MDSYAKSKFFCVTSAISYNFRSRDSVVVALQLRRERYKLDSRAVQIGHRCCQRLAIAAAVPRKKLFGQVRCCQDKTSITARFSVEKG